MSHPHFSALSLSCPDCHQNFMQPLAYDMLEEFRAAIGKPVIPTSGYRCAVYNRKVGGAQRSQHQFGTAADVIVVGMTAAELEKIARTCKLIKGIGRNGFKDFIHVDCRAGDRVFWCYNEAGQQVSYYPPEQPTPDLAA